MKIVVPARLLQKMMEHSCQHPGLEVIGFLIGSIRADQVLVTEVASGDIISRRTSTAFRQEAMAGIFQELLDGSLREKGRIVGWYHSHPGFGLFLSQTDIDTTVQLQQFDPRVVAIVVESQTREIGAFSVANGQVVSLPIVPEGGSGEGYSLPKPGAIMAPSAAAPQVVNARPQILPIISAVLIAALVFGLGGFGLGFLLKGPGAEARASTADPGAVYFPDKYAGCVAEMTGGAGDGEGEEKDEEKENGEKEDEDKAKSSIFTPRIPRGGGELTFELDPGLSEAGEKEYEWKLNCPPPEPVANPGGVQEPPVEQTDRREASF